MINNMFLDYKDCSWKLEIESCNLCRIIIISNTTIKIINKNVRIMISNTRLNRFSLKIFIFPSLDLRNLGRYWMGINYLNVQNDSSNDVAGEDQGLQ